MNNDFEKANPLSQSGDAPNDLPAGFYGRINASFNKKLLALIDRPLPEELSKDPEQARRARLITRLGVLGSLFGVTYAIFYLLIGHLWGATIILIFSAGVLVTPILMCWRKSVVLAGHFLAFILTMGFSALCCVEGGLHGHAIAWLVSVPLSALLLLGQKQAGRWVVISFFAASVIVALDFVGEGLPVMYNPKWTSVVSAAGYLGLILFMYILGLIFESGRANASARMQEALRKLATTNEHLIRLNMEKNEFLGIVAHDLKNPLTAIAGSAELLNLTKDPDQVKKLSCTIAGAAKRMHDLIINLLNANAIEQGRFTSNLERCDINALVEQSVEHNQTTAAKKQITIRSGTSDELWAKADRAATLQILDNLISNALKYSPPNTTVYVHSLPEKDYVLVTVRDEGPGISKEDQAKLFQKFSRLTARPTGGESSTGLGLAIAKRLAEAMSGTVQCHSTLGAGSTFFLRLPVWTDYVNDQIISLPLQSRTFVDASASVPQFSPEGQQIGVLQN